MGRKRVPEDARKYKTPEERRAQILATAYEIARDDGLGKVTFAEVARRIETSAPLIYRHFSSVGQLRDNMLHEAVRRSNADIVADAVELRLHLGDVPPALLAKAQQILKAA